MPRVLSIVAPSNDSGKTSLILTLLRARPGRLTALKSSTVYKDGRNCPRTNSGCACRRLQGEFAVITDMEVIAQPGTDTGRMVEAGAARTIWCLARPGAHEAMWSALCAGVLAGDEPVIAEGTGALDVMKPESIVMVASTEVPRERWKDSTWPIMRRADLVIVNRRGRREDRERLVEEISSRSQARIVTEDVSLPLERWGDPYLSGLLASFEPAGGH